MLRQKCRKSSRVFFLIAFFPQELRKDKIQELINLNQEKMCVKRVCIEVHPNVSLCNELVSNMRSRMTKFVLGLSRDLVLECKAAMLITTWIYLG